MTRSIFSIIFVSLIGVSSIQSMANEPIQARSSEFYIDGVISGKQAVKGWVSNQDLHVLTHAITQYQASPASILRMSAEAKQAFLASADRVTEQLAGNENKEVKHWVSEVNKAKMLFHYLWNTIPAVQPIGEVMLPEMAIQRNAFKLVYFAKPIQVKEISHEVPASPEQVQKFKEVFFQNDNQVAPLQENWLM